VDGLRAIAILAVIVYHAVSEAGWAFPWLAAPLQLAPIWWLTTLASKGSHGVDLFFVISGFCLAYPSLARLRSGGKAAFDVRAFFAKRIARIVPPYYAAIVVIVLGVIVAGHFGIARPSAVARVFSPLSIVRQLLFLDHNVDLVNRSFWTLAVELRWYLAFPLLLLLYVRSERAFLALLAGCVIAFNFTQLRAVDIGTLPGFMLGIVAADWHIRRHRLAAFSMLGLLISVDVALLLEPFASVPSRFGTNDEAGFYVQTNAGWQLASFFFVVAAGRFAWLRKLLEFPALCFIGLSAYGIYLVHQPIISMWDRNAGANVSPLANVAVAIGLSLVGGLAFSYLAEHPFLTERVRTRLLAALQSPLARGFALAGIPNRMELAGLASDVRVPERGAGFDAPPPAAARELHPSGVAEV
jgi:peptidoglycan/LPS O-acetylase OafA/YrhL